MFRLALTQVASRTCQVEFNVLYLRAIYFMCSCNSSRNSVSKIATIPTSSDRPRSYLLSRFYLPLRGQSK